MFLNYNYTLQQQMLENQNINNGGAMFPISIFVQYFVL